MHVAHRPPQPKTGPTADDATGGRVAQASTYRLLRFWVAVALILVGLSTVGGPALADQDDGTILPPDVNRDGTILQPGDSQDGTIPQPSGNQDDARIVISEFMANNDATILDEDGDTPDWIELKNLGDVPIDLAGYALTDEHDNLSKWTFPSVVLPPGSHLLVFASGKNRTDPASELHTNFALERTGEYLGLVSPNGTVLDDFGPSYLPQYADISYGVDGTGLRRYLPLASPGTSNDLPSNRGPLVVGLAQSPSVIYSGDEFRVLTVVRPSASPIFSVELRYRVMYRPETTVNMGLEGVDNAGNLIYSATIPAADFAPGDMVRYYTVAFDVQNYYTRWPLVGNPNNSPYYFGTVIADATIPGGVPTLHWFVRDEAAAETRDGTRGSVFFEGRFYDNILVRTRGVTAATRPKKSFKFEFNDGYELQLSTFNHTVDEINVNSNIDDASYIRQILAWEAFRDAGSPYSFALPLRVQRNGGFFGLFTMIEQPDSDYFKRNDLDYDGALYKVDANTLAGNTSGLDKRTRKDEDMSDVQALMAGIHLPGEEREAYLFDNINLPAVLNFLAVSHVIQDWDYVSHNHYLYRDTEDTGEWMFLPWDKDLTFGTVQEDGTNSHPFHGSSAHPVVFVDSGQSTYNHLFEALYTTPRIRDMYLRRLRTVSDLLLQPPDTPAEDRYFDRRIDELSTQLADVAALDAARWYVSMDFATATNWLKVHSLDVKRRQLYEQLDVAAGGIFPAAQPTLPQVYFAAIDAAVAGQAPRSEYFVLHNYGSDAIDISGWKVTGAVEYTFQPGTIIPPDDSVYVTKDAHAFRARTVAPHGGQKLFIQEGYKGTMDDDGGALWLRNRDDHVVDTASFGDVGANTRQVFLPFVSR